MAHRPNNLWRHAMLLIASLLLLAAPAHASAAATTDKAHQYKLEAAFLYNFLNYITWPGYDAPDELPSPTICVLQGDPIEPYLTYVQQKMAEQRPLTVRHLAPEANADGCSLFFSRRGYTPPTKTTIPILTVSADASNASMISMRAEEDGVALRINNTMLSEQGFQASSRLLSLAQEVK